MKILWEKLVRITVKKMHDVNINDLLQTAPKQVTYPDESDSESDV